MFFEVFLKKGDTGQFFWEIIAWAIKFSLTQSSTFLGGRGFNILIHKYFSEEWGQISQFSQKSKTTEGNSAAMYFP